MAIERWWPRWGPARGSFRVQVRMEREMEKAFGRLFREHPWSRWTGETGRSAPAVAMLDRKEEVILRADFPALNQQDITVAVEDGVLTIRGERKQASEEDDCSEPVAGFFARSLTLATGVDADRVSATFKDGVLEVHLPKTTEAEGKMIEILVGGDEQAA